MVRYVYLRALVSKEVVGVFDREREVVIPKSEDNTDWQSFVKWLEDGNEPDEVIEDAN